MCNSLGKKILYAVDMHSSVAEDGDEERIVASGQSRRLHKDTRHLSNMQRSRETIG